MLFQRLRTNPDHPLKSDLFALMRRWRFTRPSYKALYSFIKSHFNTPVRCMRRREGRTARNIYESPHSTSQNSRLMDLWFFFFHSFSADDSWEFTCRRSLLLLLFRWSKRWDLTLCPLALNGQTHSTYITVYFFIILLTEKSLLVMKLNIYEPFFPL